MKTRIAVALLGAAVMTAVAVPAEAQLGGFLKQKAKEAAKAPVAQEQNKQQSEDAAARALSQPDIVPITQESTDRFKTGLTLELKLRGEFRTFLASLKTREEYDACKGEVAMSPEAQQLSMQLLNLPDKATPADMQKLMTKIATDLEALTRKRCGNDPAEWNQNKRAERLREIQGEASDAAAPPGYVAPARDEPAPISGPWAVTFAEAPAGPHPFQIAYAMMTERWPVFCDWYASQTKKEDGGAYQKIPGVGNGVYVFSKDEAKVMPANCPSVMALLMKVLEPVSKARIP